MPTTITAYDSSEVPLLALSGPDTHPTVPNVLPGEPGLPTIPGYEVISELGRGGMGIVYKARDLKLKRLVAIKMLLDPDFASTEQRIRFKIEAEAVAQLTHPNIVQVYELGEMPGGKTGIPHPFMVLEYIEGTTLYRYLRQQTLSEREAAGLMMTLARAMQHAHEHGLIHRDLKPANILLDQSHPAGSHDKPSTPGTTAPAWHPKITDFGLVKALDFNGEGLRDLTKTELIVGTPQYMAPEQASPKPVPLSCSVDLYSLGVILYELLTGKLPYDDGDILQMLMEMQTKDPASPRSLKPQLSIDLETICLKCLEKDPKSRYASAAALADDLGRFLSNEPILARPLSEWQRVARWVRRHPMVASLVGLLFGVITLALIVIANLWRQADQDRREAVDQFHLAETARDIARTAEDQARSAARAAKTSEEQAQQALYFSKIAQSDLLLRQGRLDRPTLLLRECEASPTMSAHRSWEWSHLLRLCRPMEVQLTSSNDYVQRVVFHPTMRRLFSIEGAEYFAELGPEAYPGRLLMHDPSPQGQDWKSTLLFTGKLPFRDLQVTTDGAFALVQDLADNLTIVDLPAQVDVGKVYRARTMRRNHHGRLAARTDQLFLWSKTATEGNIIIFDMKAGTDDKTFRLPGVPQQLAVSEDGKRVLFLLKNYTLGLWDVGDATVLWQQHLPKGDYRITLSPDGSQAALCTTPVGDLLWVDAQTGKTLLKVPHLHGESVSLARTNDCLALHASSPSGQEIMVWRQFPDQPINPLPFHLRGQQGHLTGYRFSEDGQQLVSYGIDGIVRLWDTSANSGKAGNCQQLFSGHKGTILAAAFDPMGNTVVSSGIDANVMLWNTQHNVNTDRYSVNAGCGGEWISGYSFIQGTNLMAVFDHQGGRLHHLDLQTRQNIKTVTLPEVYTGFRAPRYDCSFSADGHRLALIDKKLQRGLVFDTLTGKLLLDTPLEVGLRILQCFLSGDGKRLLLASAFAAPPPERRLIPFRCDYQVWDIDAKKLVLRAELPRSFHSWAINYDGSKVAASVMTPEKKQELTRLLVNEQGRPAYSVPFNRQNCNNLAFSPDSQYLAGCNFHAQRNWLTIRDAHTGKELHRPTSAFESTSVTFTPDSRRVLVTGYDSNAIMFDTRTGHEVLTLKHHGTPRQNDYALTPRLVFNHDATKLAVHAWDASITIWHAYGLNDQDEIEKLPRLSPEK